MCLRDGVIRGAIVEVDGTWDYFAAAFKFLGVVEYRRFEETLEMLISMVIGV